MNELTIVSFHEVAQWVAAALAFIVSLLTLYNSARLRQGIIAASAASSGIGMLFLAFGFLLLATQGEVESEWMSIYHISFIAGFILLGFGSFKIYQMSKIK